MKKSKSYVSRLANNLASVTLGAFLFASPIKAQNIKPFAELSIGYDNNTSPTNITNIPSYMREISPNPVFDTYYSTTSASNPILNDTVSFRSPTDMIIGLKVGENVSFLKDKVNINIGAGLDFKVDEASQGSGDYYQLSYYKDYDPSPWTNYVYYKFGYCYLSKWNSLMRPNIFVETKLKFLDCLNVGVGYELTEQDLVLQNGWNGNSTPPGGSDPEKWDDSKINEIYILSKQVIGKPYVSLNFNEDYALPNLLCGLQLLVGFPHPIYQDVTESVKVNYKNNLFIAANILGKFILPDKK